MSDYIHQFPSPTAHTVTADGIAEEFSNLEIDVNRPGLNDPMDDKDQDSSVPDCRSVVSADQSGTALSLFNGSGLTELGEGHKVYCHIKEKFLSRLAALGAQATVVAIHKSCHSSSSAKARALAFEVWAQAVQKKAGRYTANARYLWHATSKEEVSRISSFGFGCSGNPENNGLCGRAAYFAPLNHPLESVNSAPLDKDGLQHLLICRVILGKSELISRCSKQSHPSSDLYDSGIDNLSSPRRYTVWITHANIHVLLQYVVSFKVLRSLRGPLRNPEKSRNPNAPWIPFRFFIAEFSKTFPQSDVSLITKYYQAYEGGKIPRRVLVHRIRQITGDRWLLVIIKSFRAKHYGA